VEKGERKETEKARSGRVQVTRYIREPIICWYKVHSCWGSEPSALTKGALGSMGV